MNLISNTTWSLGVLIGLPAVILTLIACAIGIVLAAKFDDFSPEFGVVTGSILAAIVIVGSLFAYYPYSSEYHQWRPVVGTVTAVDSRLLTTGSGDSASVNTRFVVSLTDQTAGDPNATGGQYACDDTRCAQVRPGDVIGLSCKRAWQFSGTDGYDCNYVGRKVA